MARFGTVAAFYVQGKRYKAGTIFADTPGNALPGDVVWVGLSSAAMSPMFVPLDGSATSMKSASVFTGSPVPCFITGANSIDA
jgi:hypothetical protein